MDKNMMKNYMAMVLEANSLKRKRSEKCKEISEMESMLETLEKKKKIHYYILSSVVFYGVLLY